MCLPAVIYRLVCKPVHFMIIYILFFHSGVVTSISQSEVCCYELFDLTYKVVPLGQYYQTSTGWTYSPGLLVSP